jgi:RecA-family ATPase
MVGGDENSAKDIGMVVHGCSILQRAFSTAVTLLHHSNRADRGERGSGALRGASDSMIEVIAGGDGMIRVACSKTKDEEEWETEKLAFHQVDRSGVLIPIGESLMFTLKLTSAEKSIMEFIALSAFESASAQTSEIERALNISPRHVYRLLSGLKNKGMTCDVSKGHPTVLTEVGREMLLTFSDKSLPITETLGKVEVD